jgi:hypothetical protein
MGLRYQAKKVALGHILYLCIMRAVIYVKSCPQGWIELLASAQDDQLAPGRP